MRQVEKTVFILAAKNGLLVSADGFWHAMQELREE